MYILLRSRGRLRFAPPFEMLRSAPHFFCVGCLIYKILNTVGTVSAPYLRGTVSHSLHTYNRGNRLRSVPTRNRFPLTPYPILLLLTWKNIRFPTSSQYFATTLATTVEKYPLSSAKAPQSQYFATTLIRSKALSHGETNPDSGWSRKNRAMVRATPYF